MQHHDLPGGYCMLVGNVFAREGTVLLSQQHAGESMILNDRVQFFVLKADEKKHLVGE